MKEFKIEKDWIELLSKSINQKEEHIESLDINLIYKYMLMYADKKTIAEFRHRLLNFGYIG
jgi:hypothetical protein